MKQKQVSLRYDSELIEPRVDALLPIVQEHHEAIKLSRGKILLMALLEGLGVLEDRYFDMAAGRSDV